jgi:hypothetical protein
VPTASDNPTRAGARTFRFGEFELVEQSETAEERSAASARLRAVLASIHGGADLHDLRRARAVLASAEGGS